MDKKTEEKLSGEIKKHRAILDEYIQKAGEIDEQIWQTPVAAEKWTPAQITEHLIETYQLVVNQARGGPGLRVQTGFLLQKILRLLILPRIYRTRRLPGGAKSPKELLPTDSGQTRQEALRQLLEVGDKFEETIWSLREDDTFRLKHHIFGEIEIVKATEFIAIHTEHHGRQLPGFSA